MVRRAKLVSVASITAVWASAWLSLPVLAERMDSEITEGGRKNPSKGFIGLGKPMQRQLPSEPPVSLVPPTYKAAGVIFYTRDANGQVSHVLMGARTRTVHRTVLGQRGDEKVTVPLFSFPVGERYPKKVEGWAGTKVGDNFFDTAMKWYLVQTGDAGGLSKYLDKAASGQRQGGASCRSARDTPEVPPAFFLTQSRLALVFCEIGEPGETPPTKGRIVERKGLTIGPWKWSSAISKAKRRKSAFAPAPASWAEPVTADDDDESDEDSDEESVPRAGAAPDPLRVAWVPVDELARAMADQSNGEAIESHLGLLHLHMAARKLMYFPPISRWLGFEGVVRRQNARRLAPRHRLQQPRRAVAEASDTLEESTDDEEDSEEEASEGGDDFSEALTDEEPTEEEYDSQDEEEDEASEDDYYSEDEEPTEEEYDSQEEEEDEASEDDYYSEATPPTANPGAKSQRSPSRMSTASEHSKWIATSHTSGHSKRTTTSHTYFSGEGSSSKIIDHRKYSMSSDIIIDMGRSRRMATLGSLPRAPGYRPQSSTITSVSDDDSETEEREDSESEDNDVSEDESTYSAHVLRRHVSVARRASRVDNSDSSSSDSANDLMIIINTHAKLADRDPNAPPDHALPHTYSSAGVMYYTADESGKASHILLGVRMREMSLKQMGMHSWRRVQVPMLQLPFGERTPRKVKAWNGTTVGDNVYDTAMKWYMIQTGDAAGLSKYLDGAARGQEKYGLSCGGKMGVAPPVAFLPEGRLAMVFCQVGPPGTMPPVRGQKPMRRSLQIGPWGWSLAMDRLRGQSLFHPPRSWEEVSRIYKQPYSKDEQRRNTRINLPVLPEELRLAWVPVAELQRALGTGFPAEDVKTTQGRFPLHPYTRIVFMTSEIRHWLGIKKAKVGVELEQTSEETEEDEEDF